ncbi:hypothetical protein OEJ37_21155 [Burkholderia sp. BKH01]|uniref:hypothetical protein n=1 Tax=Burkholderia sp. BKH01 TaxID=2769262 RepID=UPI0021E08A9E|nr:hypothetical protein [Burkholderia sp. BKH01]MCU9955873.1 hypothetical protein [Burkholderia sp. BKH01]
MGNKFREISIVFDFASMWRLIDKNNVERIKKAAQRKKTARIAPIVARNPPRPRHD